MKSERERRQDAARVDGALTRSDRVERDDLFRELDGLVRDLAERDALLDSRIRWRVTRIRAIAATLIPKPPPPVKCPDCSKRFASVSALEDHAHFEHGGPAPAWLARLEAIAYPESS